MSEPPVLTDVHPPTNGGKAAVLTADMRAKIAWRSWLLTMVYALICIAINTAHAFSANFVDHVDFNWEAFLALASPALAYVGIPDAWVQRKKQ